MNNKEQDYKVSHRNYLVIASIIVSLFVLMIIIANLNYFVSLDKKNADGEANNISYSIEKEKQAAIKPSCLIVTGKDKNDSIGIVEASLKKAKIGYISKEKLKDITDSELQEAEIIIVNGMEFSNLGNVDIFQKCLKKGKHIIFTSMPDVDYINTSGLDKIMGIKNITQLRQQKGVKFLPGFMLGGLLELSKLSYKAPEVKLLSTTKTYVTGSKNSAVIWRNTYNESEIYVVNGPFFQTNAGYGILSAIISQIYTDYMYPVINAKVFTYTGLPYVSYDNTSELGKRYNRNAMQLQKDILIPDILSINNSRSLIPSAFLTVGFDKNHSDETNKYSKEQINNYEEDIYRFGEEVGMVYSGNLKRDIETYRDLFKNKSFNSIRINEEDLEAVDTLMNKEQFSSIESILGPWKVGMKSFEYLNDSTVYIPFTIDGVLNTDEQKLEFYSAVTAFGAIVQNLDLEKVVFPKDDKDDWMQVSREYTKFIDSYREKFQMIKARNISDTAKSVEKSELNSPTIQYGNNKIIVKFEKWYGESCYFLRTNKEIESITGGSVQKVEDGVYLVTIKNKEADINLRQIDSYK